MTTTEIAPPKRPERPASKELRELGRKFKSGLRWERTGSDHYRIRDRHTDRLIEFRGRPIEVSQNPSPGVLKALVDELTEARVLKGTEARAPKDESTDLRRERLRATVAARATRRQAEVVELRGLIAPYFDKLGGVESRGVVADVAIAARQLEDFDRRFTPDLLAGSLYRLAKGQWIEPRYQEVWRSLAAHLDAVEDPVDEMFKLIRKGRGLSDDVVATHPIAPASKDGEWPFTVELLPLERLLVDHTYQRPVDWPWVRKTASTFDETLVGTIDVSSRAHGASFAVMDGQGRFEVLKMVGKTSCYASVYQGLDVESEARFFLHKNQDRKAVHPFHIYKAKLTARTPETLRITEIVEQFGYVMSITSASKLDNKISAIQAVEEAYRRKSDTRPECLTPTLKLLRATTFERAQGQAAMLIKGTGRFFQVFDDSRIDYKRLAEIYESRGPGWLLGRSREESNSHGAQLRAFVFVVVSEHNRGKTGRDRLIMPSLGKRV